MRCGRQVQIILGCGSTADIALAMERGECSWRRCWVSLETAPYWLRDKITLLMQSGLKNDPELPDLPNALDFAKTASYRKVLELFFTQKTAARPVIAPPGIPAERLAILRAAFAALAKDREFLADAEKSNLDVDPMSGEEVDKVVALITSAPADVIARYTRAFAGAGQPH